MPETLRPIRVPVAVRMIRNAVRSDIGTSVPLVGLIIV